MLDPVRRGTIPGAVLWFLFLSFHSVVIAGPKEEANRRTGLSTGLGVSYVRATDIVDRINGTGITTERASDFTAAAEFFGSATHPVSPDLVLKLEYAYLLASYNVPTVFGGSEFCLTAHLPTLILQYSLIDKGIYNVKAGFGVGYHFGTYREKYGTVDDKYTGGGIGTKIDLEANTAFGESFYAYIGGDIRMSFIGALENPDASPSGNVPDPGLNFFSIGAKLGFTFYF